VRVSVRGQGDDLARVIDRLLSSYASAPGDGELTFTLERRAERPAPPAEPPRFHFPPLGAWPVPGGFRLVDDVADVTVTTDTGLSGWVAADAPLPVLSRFAGLTLWIALIECLRARGRFPLHAASLVAPDGHTVLVAGTKGAGKSTATLALAERGWRVVSDDTVLVSTAGVTGYRKRFHVCPDLLERRPDLAPLARRAEAFEPQDKLWLDLEARLPGCTVERAGMPHVILFPRIVDRATTALEPVSGKDALMALMRESSFVFVRPELTAPHLGALGRLVDGARCYALHAGRDLLADPSAYDQLARGRAREEVSWRSSA
jgi:hypothetical protein